MGRAENGEERGVGTWGIKGHARRQVGASGLRWWFQLLLRLVGVWLVIEELRGSSFGGIELFWSGDCCCSVVFELRVPSLWAPSREGCVRWSRVEAQSRGECWRELADRRTTRVQVTSVGLVGPIRSARLHAHKGPRTRSAILVFWGWPFSFGILNECCGAESEK